MQNQIINCLRKEIVGEIIEVGPYNRDQQKPLKLFAHNATIEEKIRANIIRKSATDICDHLIDLTSDKNNYFSRIMCETPKNKWLFSHLDQLLGTYNDDLFPFIVGIGCYMDDGDRILITKRFIINMNKRIKLIFEKYLDIHSSTFNIPSYTTKSLHDKLELLVVDFKDNHIETLPYGLDMEKIWAWFSRLFVKVAKLISSAFDKIPLQYVDFSSYLKNPIEVPLLMEEEEIKKEEDPVRILTMDVDEITNVVYNTTLSYDISEKTRRLLLMNYSEIISIIQNKLGGIIDLLETLSKTGSSDIRFYRKAFFHLDTDNPTSKTIMDLTNKLIADLVIEVITTKL